MVSFSPSFQECLLDNTLRSTMFSMFRTTSSVNASLFGIGIGLVNYLFWSTVINKRFEKLVNPYFEKYEIKWFFWATYDIYFKIQMIRSFQDHEVRILSSSYSLPLSTSDKSPLLINSLLKVSNIEGPCSSHFRHEEFHFVDLQSGSGNMMLFDTQDNWPECYSIGAISENPVSPVMNIADDNLALIKFGFDLTVGKFAFKEHSDRIDRSPGK